MPFAGLFLWLFTVCAGPESRPSADIAGTAIADRLAASREIRIEPESLTLRRGETHQLTVTGEEVASEKRESATLVWRSERPIVAVVDDEGRVTARGLGETTVTASLGDARASSHVKVVDLAPPPDAVRPDETIGGGGPNEPDGFEVLANRTFRELREDGWSASGNLDVVEERDGSGSISTVGHIRFDSGFEGGRTPGWTTIENLERFGARSIYISFRVRLSENWQSVGSGVSKIGFVWMHDNPVVFPTNWTYRGDPIEPQIRLQRTPDGARNLYPNVGHVEIRRGEWTQWEILLVANSGDNRNGEAHWWIDGIKVGEYRNVIYGSSDQEKDWQRVAWRPTWGGVDDVVRDDMSMWMDRLFVSGHR